MACPGSFRVANAVTEPAAPSIYATVGTIAHSVAENLLENGGPLDRQLGQTIHRDGHDVTIDQDMLESVEIYLNTIDPIIAEADFWSAEQVVDLNRYWLPGYAPVDLFGTCDLFAYKRATRRLTIADYKHGAGVFVDHIDNAQTLYYAAGALALLKLAHPDEKPLDVEMMIVQPRAPGREPVRSQVLPVIDILLWVDTVLKPAVERTQLPDAELCPGDHCRWCPGRVICPAMQALTQRAFSVISDDISDATDADLGKYLDQAEKIEIWIQGCREEAQRRIENGARISGWGLAPKRPTRVWDDEAAVVAYLRGAGYYTDDIFKHEIYSPAQMQKHIDPKHWKIVQKSIDVRSSGLKLARTIAASPFDPVSRETAEPREELLWST